MLKTIARYSTPIEAQIAWSKLDAMGVEAYIADQHTINMQWLYSNAIGGVRLQVPEHLFEQAAEILELDLESALIEEQGYDVATCPKCGSNDTEYKAIGRRAAFLVFLGLNFPLFPVRQGVKCNSCGFVSRA